jgi:hypothetical protein
MANSLNGIKIVCSKCGSSNILEKMWFNPNSGETFGWDESDECYCKDCCEMTTWVEKQ